MIGKAIETCLFNSKWIEATQLSTPNDAAAAAAMLPQAVHVSPTPTAEVQVFISVLACIYMQCMGLVAHRTYSRAIATRAGANRAPPTRISVMHAAAAPGEAPTDAAIAHAFLIIPGMR